MIKLSIIIPAYNAEPYIDELINMLKPQITDEIEVLVVDDGSRQPYLAPYDFVKVYRKENGGCSTARNLGLDKAIGEYVSFIDADDMIPHYFVQTLLEKIKGGYDVIDFSWKSLSKEGAQHDHRLMSDADWLTNPSVCTRAFKRSFIGDIRFNEQKDSTEDEDFSRKVGYLFKDAGFKHGAISEYMYFYRTAVTNSKIKRFKKGLMKTKRIVYHVPYVSADRMDLLEEIKAEDQKNEVWLLTQQCDIPEMRKYCQIHKPFAIWGHELRGEKLPQFEKINPPRRTQIVLYCEYANKVGGISTFIYNFCKELSRFYEIIFVYDRMDIMQLSRIVQYVPVMKNGSNTHIMCDTLILNRLTDKIPDNITFKKTVQVCHCCKQLNFDLPKNRDILVNVSEAARSSWGDQAKDGIVIHNMVQREAREMLFLVSATRVGASDKGSNDSRMLKLANMLHEKKIPFIWFNFSDGQLRNAPKGFYNMPATLKVQDYIKKADYLVQLSDEEAYSYAVLEALINDTAVIATPFESGKEQGLEDGVTGYIVPYDMDFDVTKLLNIPRFKFAHTNEPMIQKWTEILGTPHCREDFEKQNAVVTRVLRDYYDMELGQELQKGTELIMRKERAKYVKSFGHIEIIED